MKKPYVSKTLLVILVLTIAVFLFSTQSTLWDRDEARFARIACEMLDSGQWFLPVLNGEVYAKKPPLGFWMMAISMKIFGITSAAARLPAVFSLAATGWLVFLIGRQLFSARAGFWASAILMSSVLTIYTGSAAMVDAPLLAFITLAIWAHIKGISHSKRGSLYWPVLALALGLAELTKHPVGLATVLPATFISAWLLRKNIPIPKSFWLGLAAAYAAGFALHQAWFLPVQLMTPGFSEIMVGQHIVGRFFSPMEGHGAGSLWGYLALLPVYVPILLIGFAPWSVFLPAGAARLMRGRVGDQTARIFLLSWALPIFILFSLSATKLPHYILPVFPPAALVVAATLDRWRIGPMDEKDMQWLHAGKWLLFLFPFMAVLFLCLSTFFMGGYLWRMAIVIPVAAVAAFNLTGFFLIRNARVFSAARLFLVGTPALMIFSAWLILPVVEPLIKISPVLAETIRTHRLKEEPVAMCGYTEPSFFFYMNLPADQTIAVLNQHPRTLNGWFGASEGGWLVVYDSIWKQATDRFGPMERARTRRIVPVLNTNDDARQDRVRVIERLPRNE